MLRYHMIVLVVAAMVCSGSTWRIFPLPDKPQAVNRSPTVYTTSRPAPVPTKTPAALLQTTAVFPTGGPSKNTNVLKPATVPAKEVKQPAKDLLPPKEDAPV